MSDALVDDLGSRLLLHHRPRRVVSLVPSLTEAISATCPDTLVGATDWCTHPHDLDVPRVRGTKNPDVEAITQLMPDLVVANMEENRERDVQRLRAAGIPVWVTRIESVDQALASLRRLLVDVLGQSAPDWLMRAADEWGEPAAPSGLRVAVPIWRDPWMVVGGATFTGDLVSRLGLTHVHAGTVDRYPHVDLADLDDHALDLVLLPDEPYAFSAQDGPEAFPSVPTALVSGRLLTWYGPSLVGARSALEEAISRSQAAGPGG